MFSKHSVNTEWVNRGINEGGAQTWHSLDIQEWQVGLCLYLLMESRKRTIMITWLYPLLRTLLLINDLDEEDGRKGCHHTIPKNQEHNMRLLIAVGVRPWEDLSDHLGAKYLPHTYCSLFHWIYIFSICSSSEKGTYAGSGVLSLSFHGLGSQHSHRHSYLWAFSPLLSHYSKWQGQ